MKILNCFFLISVCYLAVSCENNSLKDIQKMNANKFYAAGEAEDINVKYTDSAKIKAILVSKKMLDYSQVKYPFTHFPNKVHVTVFDNNKNKTFVVANKATAYNKTNIIDYKARKDNGESVDDRQLRKHKNKTNERYNECNRLK